MKTYKELLLENNSRLEFEDIQIGDYIQIYGKGGRYLGNGVVHKVNKNNIVVRQLVEDVKDGYKEKTFDFKNHSFFFEPDIDKFFDKKELKLFGVKRISKDRTL